MSAFFIKYFSLIFMIFLTGSILLLSDSDCITVHILATVLLGVTGVFTSKFDLMHPNCWFSVIFTLYSISYPILYEYAYVSDFGYTKELMILQWIALSVFLLIVTPKSQKLDIMKLKLKSHKSWIYGLLINIFSVMIVIACYSINEAGFMNKKEIYSSDNIFLSIIIRVAILLTIVYVYQLISITSSTNKVDKQLIFKVFLSMFLITIFTGERDLFFRFIVVTIFVLYAFGKIKRKHLFLMLPLGILILPLSHMYKYFFLTGISSVNVENLNAYNLFFVFLSGEFLSASRNLQVLLNHSDYTNSLFLGTSIINDFIKVILPTEFTHGKWYNDTFFPHISTTGYGFTIVGEGYINFGYPGVIIVFMIMSCFIRYLYMKSSENIYWLSIYIFTIPMYMYSIRADLSNIFSPFFKSLLLSMIFIRMLENFLKKYQHQGE